ncbi:hypothetical protein AruPA_19380 [Acidiphilium sp. PA]|uniref:hypothetical protein n=1 Tax=Acidiphilium sp. PA TaxID=2871705 RepID=UPI00224477BE|nr:hypothetical protein [Acidiphilium sp. PA]MCW8309199.1 hypothetical protein [Acidiphilium sp. PA]
MVVHALGRIVGYYGLAPTAIVSSTLPRAIRTGQPPDPVPCILLGQLATDHAWAVWESVSASSTTLSREA